MTCVFSFHFICLLLLVYGFLSLPFLLYTGFFLLFATLTSFSLYRRWCSANAWSLTHIYTGNCHSISQFREIGMFVLCVCLYESWNMFHIPNLLNLLLSLNLFWSFTNLFKIILSCGNSHPAKTRNSFFEFCPAILWYGQEPQIL